MTWLKDPLWIFLICGAGIFVAAGFLAEDDIPYSIDVRDADVKRLQDQWQMQMRRQPTQQELGGLVEQFVKEEIYYREAQRLGLDANDTIVRRRMVQKLTFLTEDIATAVPSDEPTLQAFYQDHIEDYRLPHRYTFKHRYYSVDRRQTAEADARLALADSEDLGDPFMLQKSYALRSEREIGDLFGREFAQQLAALTPAENWQGPLRSAYGWHVVLMSGSQPSEVQSFAQVRARVVADAQQAARADANNAYYTELQDRYQITYPDAEQR